MNIYRKYFGKEFFPLIIIIVATAVITFFHYGTPSHSPLLHGLYRRLYYLPVIIAALYYGKSGGIVFSLIIIILYLPHIIMTWGKIPLQMYEALFELLLYLIVGVLTGIIIDKKRYEEKEKNMLIQSFKNSEQTSTLGEIAFVMSHELKTPVASILGAVNILKDEYKIEGEYKKFFEIIVKESRRIDLLVNERVESFKQGEIKKEKINLKLFLREISELTYLIIQKRDIVFENKCDTDQDVIYVDVDLFKQIFINLINNSIQNLGDNKLITLSCYSDENSIYFLLKDNGNGMDEEEIKTIFNPFQSGKKNHLGLGLAIVKRVVELHEGNISCNSQVGYGTTFSITIPI